MTRRPGGKRSGAPKRRGPVTGGGEARASKAKRPPKKRAQPQERGAKRANVIGGSARFVGSVDSAEAAPAGPPEIAFAGRSNVGKSSLLNALSNHKSLARTSKTPGRTQRVNLFDVSLSGGVAIRFADLPGYGHAKVPGAVRAGFGPMIEGYLTGQSRLKAVCLLVDSRREPDEDAVNFTLWLQERGIRVELVVTKIDKIAKNKRFGVLEKLKRAHFLSRRPFATSSSNGEGVDELRSHLARLAQG